MAGKQSIVDPLGRARESKIYNTNEPLGSVSINQSPMRVTCANLASAAAAVRNTLALPLVDKGPTNTPLVRRGVNLSEVGGG